MTISILTLFPQMFAGPFDQSIIKRASDNKHITINIVNIRDFSTDTYKSVDDRPYGGGHGMVMRVDILDQAIQSVLPIAPRDNTRIILLDPQGVPYVQTKAQSLTSYTHLILVCGHYEGIDERVRSLVDEELSIGDYVMTGGEIPAMVVVDSVTRLLPGVLPKEAAPKDESFSLEHGLLEYPHYTKPQSYNGMDVPEILLSGNHQKIHDWRMNEAKTRTKKRRPDLLKK